MGSETLSSACYILSDESSIPLNSKSNGYKNVTEEKWKREDKPRAVLHVPYRKKPSAFVSLFVKKCVLELFFSKCVPEVLFGNASGCTMLKHIQTAPQSNICLKICSSVSFCVKKCDLERFFAIRSRTYEWASIGMFLNVFDFDMCHVNILLILEDT